MMAKKIEDEAQEDSRFRSLSGKFFNSSSIQRKLKTNLRVLDFCSTYDHVTSWKQARKLGNSTLFNRTADYREWKGRTASCTHIYTGKLGSGKSVLLANIVDDLNLHAQSKRITVAYFFCRHDISASLKAQTVLGSLARQLLYPLPDLTKAANFATDTISSSLASGKFFSLLKFALPLNSKAYFILDGLDELKSDERKTIIQQLKRLQETIPLLLCVSLRVDPNNVYELSSEQFVSAKITAIPEDNPDINAFIGAELERCIKSRDLRLGHPDLILEIRDALLKGSQGMFLWVALQIKSLCSMKTDDAIQKALADLPRDLSETFYRILRRSEGPGESYQKRILELITVAQRHLTTEELRGALSVDPGDAVWNPAKRVNNIFAALTCCGSLLTVDEEDLTVRFVHHSVKTYLLENYKDSNNVAFTEDDANKRMADIIITYLNYGVFDRQLATMTPQISAGATLSRIMDSTLDSSSSVRNLALKLLKSKETTDYNFGKTLAKTRGSPHSRSMDEFQFYTYAKSYWQYHIMCVPDQKRAPFMDKFLRKLFAGKIVNARAVDEDGVAILSSATSRGCATVVKLLLDSGQVEADQKDPTGQTPLFTASRHGYADIVKLLLDSGKVNPDRRDPTGWTPLSMATRYGHADIVKLLLDSSQVNPDSKDVYGRTPLLSASMYGYANIAKLLLDSGEVDADSKDHMGSTPLLYASRNWYTDVFKLLLASGKVNADHRGEDGRTPLSWASQRGDVDMAKPLLDSGEVDPDSKDQRGDTPLVFASFHGHNEIVKLLLDSGQVNADMYSDTFEQTPLSSASIYGHEGVVKLLIDSGQVNVDRKDHSGRTPLSWASGNGHGHIVTLLLELGSYKIDADSKDADGRTPLIWASVKGHLHIVILLLDSGRVDVNYRTSYGQTPLSAASADGYENIVTLLLIAGAIYRRGS
jgi:ankyrin repeat protein